MMRYEPAATVKRILKPADFVPVPLFSEGHKYAGQRRCIAWSTRNGRQCEHHAMRGKNVCQKHGGLAPSGIANPNFRHGRYSKLPVRLLPSFNQSMRDPELLSLRHEISALDSRIEELVTKLDTGESGKTWRKLQSEFDIYDESMAKARFADDKNKAEILSRAAQALDNIRQLVRFGLADYANWDELRSCQRDRKNLVESERKRLVEMQQMIDSEQVMALVTALALAVKKHVSDDGILRKVNAEFTDILHRDNK